MNTVRTLLNSVAGAWARASSRVRVGEGTRINWLRLHARGGTFSVGRDSIIGCRLDFDDAGGRIEIGDRSYIGASHLVCHTRISIGSDVIISWGVTIVDHNSHAVEWAQRRDDVLLWRNGRKNWEGVAIAPVRIGDKVWIGFGASILKGVQVGEGAVIGARSVVTRDVAPYTIVAGNPARLVRELPSLDEPQV